jgi:excisionase family DNA binding protein
MMSLPNLLTISEACEVLRLKPSTVRSWILKRKMSYVKMGGRVLIRESDCQQLIQAGLRPPIQPTQEME